MSEVFELVMKMGVVPVIAIDSVEAALPLADALLEGGLPIAEITFRTAAAADVIAKMTKERPELVVGAGTVLSVENLRRAIDCGAKFGVAPGTNPEVVEAAARAGLPFVPGVVTPSEVEKAMALGCKTLKFFPSEVAGGVPMIKALVAPYGHTGVKFVPTGGVNTGNLENYLSVAAVAAVGGTWIATKDDIAQGKWAEIAERCKAAREIVSKARG